MKSFTSISMATAVIALSATAQKMEIQKPDSTRVLRVGTAKDHLTVIEMSDAVTMVAVGNRNAFTVERRENKVLVTPTDEDARTNLFIWTSGGRYAYELVPAAAVDQMHFAIDQVSAAVTPLTPAATAAPFIEKLPSEMLTEAAPVLLVGERSNKGRVEIAVRDLYRKHHRLYLRYLIVNRSGLAYSPTRPAGWLLEGVPAQQSRIPVGDHQLGEKFARSIKSVAETAITVVDAGQIALVAAGSQGWGWVVLEDIRPNGSDGVSALRLQFAADAKGTVDAMLVLKPTAQPEVARAQPAVR